VSGAGAKKGGGRSQSGYNGYAPPGYTNANGYNAQINGGWAGAYGGAGWAAPPPFGGFGTAPGFLPFGLNAAVSPAAGGIGAFGNQANPQVLSLQQQQNAIASLYNLNALGHGATTQSFLQNHSAPAVVSGKPVDGAADWAAYTAPDGRTYYYNSKTGVSSWEKPAAVGGYGL